MSNVCLLLFLLCSLAVADQADSINETIADDSWSRHLTPKEALWISSRGCDLEVLHGDTARLVMLRAATRPVLIKGLISDWPSLNWTRDEFLAMHGTIQPKLRIEMHSSGKSNELTAREYMESQDHTLTLFQREFDDLYAEVHKSYSMPRGLAELHEMPVFSLGVVGSAVHVHAHRAAWLGHAAGRKAWLLSNDSDAFAWRFNPCRLLLGEPPVPKGKAGTEALVCVAGPGDVLYLPAWTYHATCNLDELTLGFGGQGWLDSQTTEL